MGYFVAVIGFFILSSFLLTYNLFKDFKESRNGKEEFFCTIKYILRRFFRIYLSFVVFCALIKIPEYGRIIGGVYAHYNTFLNLITLQKVDEIHNSNKENRLFYISVMIYCFDTNIYILDHLWAIAPEIKYYFCIPVIVWFFKRTDKLWFMPWLISMALTFLYTYFNPFNFTEPDFKLHTGLLHPRFR
jgi:peptidoglycan/LPS O-acetylase OafA/YrhL